MATEFQKASKGKIVSDTPAMQEFERIREEASIEAAAARAGKSPEEIRAEARAAGTDPISWIKDKYPPPGMPKKPAERAPAEPVADRIETPEKKATRIEEIQSQINKGTYNPIKGIAEEFGVEEPKPKAAPKKAAKEKKKAEAAPTAQEAPKTVAEQVKSGAALNKEQEAIRSAITSAPQFAIITAESPRGESVPGGNEALKKELEARGYKFEQMEGMYGGKENPFLVQTDKLSDIQSLGKKYGQESVILADNNKYKMQFTSGPQEGQFYTANTITQYATPPKDYYSTVVRDGNPVHFKIDFDMDNLQGKSVADTDRLKKAEDKRVRKTNVAKVSAEGYSNADVAKLSSALNLTPEEVRANLSKQEFAAGAVKILAKDTGAVIPTRSTINVVPRDIKKPVVPPTVDVAEEPVRPKVFVDKAGGTISSRGDLDSRQIRDYENSKLTPQKVNKSLDDYRQKGPPPATTKGIISGVVEDVAQETGISSSQLSKALDVIENKAKLSGESLEQVAKRIPDPRLRSALGLIAVGLAGFAIGRGTDKKKESGAASTGFNEAAKKRLEELRRKKAGK